MAPDQVLLHLPLTLHVVNVLWGRILLPMIKLLLFLHEVIHLLDSLCLHLFQRRVRLPGVVQVTVLLPLDKVLLTVSALVGVDPVSLHVVGCGGRTHGVLTAKSEIKNPFNGWDVLLDSLLGLVCPALNSLLVHILVSVRYYIVWIGFCPSNITRFGSSAPGCSVRSIIPFII